jgi:hypothetical protein
VYKDEAGGKGSDGKRGSLKRGDGKRLHVWKRLHKRADCEGGETSKHSCRTIPSRLHSLTHSLTLVFTHVLTAYADLGRGG